MTLLQRVICHATDLYVGKMADKGIEMDGWKFLALGLELFGRKSHKKITAN